MKKYVIMIAATFPATHPRKGEPTFFKEQILDGVMGHPKGHGLKLKIHTIRANFPLWEHRIKEVQAGRAVLSFRQWTGKPYKSKQHEFLQLDKQFGVGIQKLTKIGGGKGWGAAKIEDGPLPYYDAFDFCTNDGLQPLDFVHWFAPYKMDQPLAIIHFTKFRY